MDHHAVWYLIARIGVQVPYFLHVILAISKIQYTLQVIKREIDTGSVIMHGNNDLWAK